MLMLRGNLFLLCSISDVPIFIAWGALNIEVAPFIPVSFVTSEELNNHLLMPHGRVKLCLIQRHIKSRNNFEQCVPHANILFDLLHLQAHPLCCSSLFGLNTSINKPFLYLAHWLDGGIIQAMLRQVLLPINLKHNRLWFSSHKIDKNNAFPRNQLRSKVPLLFLSTLIASYIKRFCPCVLSFNFSSNKMVAIPLRLKYILILRARKRKIGNLLP